MKKSEVLESYKRVLESYKTEYSFIQAQTSNFRVFLQNEEGERLKQYCVVLSEKINTLGNTILDIERIHSLD